MEAIVRGECDYSFYQCTSATKSTFKSLTLTWEQRKLGELFSERTERSSAGEMLSVTISKGIIHFNELERKDNSSIDKSNYKCVKPKDLAYNTMRMWQGACGVSEYAGIVSPAYTVARPTADTNPYFFNQLFKTSKALFLFRRFSQGLTSDTWNLKFPQFAEICFRSPSRKEQDEITKFFKTLDDLIAACERKCELLEKRKRYYLQQIFSQEIRFSGFNDPWEQRKLNHLYVRSGSGGTPKSTNLEYYGGDIPFLAITDISNSDGHIRSTSKTITQKGLDSSAAWIVPKGSISLAMYASVGKVAILDIDCATSQAFFNTVFDSNLTRDFVFVFLQMMQSENLWNPLISSGTQANLNAQKVSNLSVMIPSNSEKAAIVHLFSLADSQLRAEYLRVRLLQQKKKAFLKFLFI
jgi:type I restriction enzyme, S subunit